MRAAAIGLALVAASFGTSAFAADMPLKAPPAAYAEAYNWSGFYVGASAGWVHESSTWTYTNPVPATPPTSSAHDVRFDDAIFGGHIGALYQWQKVVLGAELAVSETRGNFGTSNLQCVATVGSQCRVSMGTLWTAGGRLGWAGWNRWLPYVSGGWARLEVRSQESTVPPLIFDNTSARQNGYYVGGGIEYAITNNFIAGIEYQHVDVGTAYHASSADGFGPSPPGVNGRNISASEDIVRARLSVKFGG